MTGFVMCWTWRLVAVALLTSAASGAPSTTVLPPHQPVDKEVQALEAIASRQPSVGPEPNEPSARQPKLLAPDRQPKLLERDRETRKTLDRGASELAWKNWLQSPENRDPVAPPRRIMAKSVFIAPSNCPEGRRIGEGCVSVHQVGKEAHEKYILEQLNNLGAQTGGVEYDYDDTTADGPLQLNLPLGPTFAAAASQHVITTVPANDKKDGNEAELERLKLELERLASVSEREPLASALGEHAAPATGKPKREHDEQSDNEHKEVTNVGEDTLGEQARPVLDEHANPLLGEHATQASENPENDNEGQKEVIFGNVSEDKYEHTINQTHLEATTDRQNATTDSTRSDEPITTNTPPKPEIDYADIGDAVKLISRYAEVTTDDSFKGERKRPPEDGPLGTRTRQQHRRKPTGIYAPSIYEDRLAAHLAYPRPPPDYPFRHVQDYWSHPERYLGPYHANPRRHHHAYPRRPPPSRADEDLYRLLALRHWYSGDADR